MKNNRNHNRETGPRSNAEARRDKNQSHDYKGEAQNVNDDKGRPLNEKETKHARNKATEGTRQGRDNDNRKSNG
jgi:hypothetical protein